MRGFSSVVAEIFSGWRRGSRGFREGFSDKAQRGCPAPGARHHSAGQSLNHATQV